MGTAPGFGVTVGACRMYFLPGVPSEMQHLFHETVVPAVVELATRDTHQEHIRTFGLTESRIAQLLEGIETERPEIVLGYRASFPEIEIKVLARAPSEAVAETAAREVATEVRERLGDAVYGGRNDTFPGVVGNALRNKGLTLAVAESCTGGLVGSMITSVAGSSDYLLADLVTYANSAKEKVLKVNPEVLRAHGAVSAETAAEMAEGVIRIAGSDLAIAITGIAGPGGGTDEKPVGTVWFGLAQKGQGTATVHRMLPGDRQRIQTLAAYLALRLVWRAALGRPLTSD
jgi:nicotinamide-nucleotide amidase